MSEIDGSMRDGPRLDELTADEDGLCEVLVHEATISVLWTFGGIHVKAFDEANDTTINFIVSTEQGLHLADCLRAAADRGANHER